MALAERHVASWQKAAARSASDRARVAKAQQRRALAASTPRLANRISRAFLALAASAVHAKAAPQVVSLKEVEYPLTYTVPAWDAFSREMRKILTQEYVTLTEAAFDAVQGQLGVTLDFDLDERIIPKGVIARRVTGVTNETKKAINSTIRQGIDDGVHPSVIAKRMRDQLHGYAGLEDLTKSRAYTIARTETANAYNLGAIAGYRQSGIVRQLTTIDAPTCGWTSHDDPDSANGKVVTLDQAAAQPISHPNCVRAFAPVAAGLEKPEPKAPRKPKDPYANPKTFAGNGPGGEPYGLGDTALEKWSAGLLDKIFGKVTQEMKDAMALYSGSGYRWMNNHLRGTDVTTQPFGLSQIRALREYLALGRTPNAVVVHRGIGSGSKFGFSYGQTPAERWAHAQALVGQPFTEKGFMSTALHREAAFGGDVTLTLTVPKGYHAVPVSGKAKGFGGEGMTEAELLLRDGAEYVFDRVERDSRGKIHLFGRVLPRKK